MDQILHYLGLGAAWIALLSVFIEFTPIKINPLQAIGDRFNMRTIEQMKHLESKLDEHIAESYRNSILLTQDKIVCGKRLTQEEWKKALQSCTAYEVYVNENKLQNEYVIEAIRFIHRSYADALDRSDFLNLV